MKLVEVANIAVKRDGMLKSDFYKQYFTIKKTLIDKISESAFEDCSNFLRCCTIPSKSKEIIRIRIFLGEPFYNKHLGKLVKDAQIKELNRWLSNIAIATPQLVYLGTGR